MNVFVLCFVLPPANGSSGCAKAERAAVLTNAAAFVIHACVNLLPARAKSPLHKRSLCNGCISLSNAEGFKRKELPYRHSNYTYKTAAMIVKNDALCHL